MKINIVLKLIVFSVLSLCTMVQLQAATADGNVRIKLQGQKAGDADKRVSIKQIEAIGLIEVKAYNPYEKREDVYTGVLMSEFVKHFAKPGVKEMTLSAIDDYSITFTASEWDNMRIVIATKVNGQYIGYDKKGPLRIAFPDYDTSKKIYQNILPKWMWMINKANFK